ncbi:hypothetical protein C4D60_Mb04t03140 [Musa balbisiana]|uniref:Uncharacterized protein n=1 Tax=Musa balbisiana TaxID=52838 RepID=A0A4S8K9D4_MUSBA|nr:hypothetical protein C4D60_Mb04t03140 [Musa balbisiana]
MSKLQSDVLREAISQVVGDSREKKRKFTETVELQIGLKNYDPQKDEIRWVCEVTSHSSLQNEGKFPTLVTHQESLEAKVNETKAMVKFQLKKVLCMGVAVARLGCGVFSSKLPKLPFTASSAIIILENSSWLYCTWFLPPNSTGNTSRSKCLRRSSMLSLFLGLFLGSSLESEISTFQKVSKILGGL